jgi:anti-sigma B factor antagonist
MALEVKIDEQGEVRIVAVAGRLDADGAVDLELALQELEAAGARHYVVDGGGLIYASNAGLRVLIGLADRMRGKGSVRLAAIPLALREAFAQTDVAQRMKAYPDRRAALAEHPAARGEADPLLSAASKLMGAAPAKSEGGAASSELSQAAARLLGAGDVKPARKRTPAPASRGGGSDPKKR